MSWVIGDVAYGFAYDALKGQVMRISDCRIPKMAELEIDDSHWQERLKLHNLPNIALSRQLLRRPSRMFLRLMVVDPQGGPITGNAGSPMPLAKPPD